MYKRSQTIPFIIFYFVETFHRKSLLYFVVAGVFFRGGVQGVVGPDGGETESNETGGQHLQEDR